MSDSNPTNTGTFYAASSSASAGATLRAAREKAGLRLDEVALKTKIPLNVLEAIEQDDTAKLGQPVYVRGYLRKYAKAMSLQETQVLTAFDARAMAPPPEASRLAEEQVVDEGGGGGRTLLWVLIAIILLAAAGAAVMYIRGWGPAALHRKPQHAAAPAKPQPAPAPIQSAPPPVEPAPTQEPSTSPQSTVPDSPPPGQQ